MGKLIVTEASGSAREVLLDKERTTIGRHSGNDICLNDKAVSGNHAAVVVAGDTLVLEDLDSTNGTLVNGRQIAKHTLVQGDTITIGRNTLKFEVVAAAAQSGDNPLTMTQSQLAREMKTINGKLKVLTGSNAGRELELTKTVTTLGKPGLQVVAITKKADGYYIAHTGGAPDGPKPSVNGDEVGHEPVKLVSGDTLVVVGTQMQFVVI